MTNDKSVFDKFFDEKYVLLFQLNKQFIFPLSVSYSLFPYPCCTLKAILVL